MGYAIGRAAGKAVVRNRVRRQLRAAVHELAPGLAPGGYLIGAGPSAASLPFAALQQALESSLVEVGALAARVPA